MRFLSPHDNVIPYSYAAFVKAKAAVCTTLQHVVSGSFVNFNYETVRHFQFVVARLAHRHSVEAVVIRALWRVVVVLKIKWM